MTLVERRKRVVQSITVDDYNHRTAGVALLTQVNTARDDETTVGNQYRWGEHYATPDAGKRVATLRHQAELARQVVFEGTGNVIGMTPGAVFRFTNRELDNAEHGLMITRVKHKASRKDAYTCEFTAIPSDRIYRSMVDSAAKPRISGILPARVMSPDNYKYAYMTPQSGYRIKLPFDLDEWSPGGTSRPVRLAKPYAGRDYGHHFPLIDGTEVAVIFTEGDPNRPVIIGAMHDSQHQDHVNNENNTRNILRTAGGNEMRMEDCEGTEHVHLKTPFQASQLNLGHMVNDQREKRGLGGEFRSDVRQGVKGLFDTWIILGGHAWESMPDLPEETLSLRVTGTNGMLPRKGLREASINDLVASAPNVGRVRNLTSPTLPVYPPVNDRFQWRVLSHLAPNFLSLMDAEVLRGALALYDWTGDELNRRRLAGIQHVSQKLLRKVIGGGIERGVLIEVTLDSHAFAGTGDVYLFGELLHRFFTLYAEINLFTQLAIISLPSGKRIEWAASHAERSPL